MAASFGLCLPERELKRKAPCQNKQMGNLLWLLQAEQPLPQLVVRTGRATRGTSQKSFKLSLQQTRPKPALHGLKPCVHGYLFSLACAIWGKQAVPLFWNDIYDKDPWKSPIPRCWTGSVGAEETRGKAAGSWCSVEMGCCNSALRVPG